MSVHVSGPFWEWVILLGTGGFTAGFAGKMADDLITSLKLRKWRKRARGENRSLRP